MTQTSGSPSHNRYSHFRCEEAVITNVNRKTWTVSVETRHSAKQIDDVQCIVPYHHYSNGEGIHHLPEVGAKCYVAWPNDNTPPFVMGYIGAAGVLLGGADPARPSLDAEGSPTDVTFRSRRPELNPGDIALTGRDENFLMLRRGGVVQIGATAIAQRIYVPVLNYIRDFAENYELNTFGGDISWTVARQELNPTGDAPSTWVLHMNEFAQDAKASLRIRHFPVASPGGAKSAWEVHVAPQGVDRDNESVSGETYSFVVTLDGDQTEFVAGGRTVTVKGDDTLDVLGNQEVSIVGNYTVSSKGKAFIEGIKGAVVAGTTVKLASEKAKSPGVLGDELVKLLSTAVWPVAPVGGSQVASPSPDFIAKLAKVLSTKVFLE